MNARSALSTLCLTLSLSACGGLLQEPPVARPYPLTGCSALDEAACNAAPGCVAIYGEEEAPQPVPFVAVASGCMPFEPEQLLPFHHCEQLAPVDPCAGLDEATCSATPGCAVVQSLPGIPEGAEGEVVLVSPAVTACVQVSVDPCAGLDEATCSTTPGCAVLEVRPGTVSGGSEDGVAAVSPAYGACVQVGVEPEPLPVDPPAPGGPVCPAVACLLYCEQGRVLDAAGCPTCECLP